MKSIAKAIFVAAGVAVCSICSAAGVFAQDKKELGGTAWKSVDGIFVENMSDSYFCPTGTSECHSVDYREYSSEGRKVHMSFADGEFHTNTTGDAAKIICQDGSNSKWGMIG